MNKSITKDKDYSVWLKEVKNKVRQAQLKAAVSVNTALLEFYWELGSDIVEKQKVASWGSGFLKQLSEDLMAEFPDMKGFSEANLHYIRRWFLFYNKRLSNSGTACARIASQAIVELTKIPWGHNRVIISKCNNTKVALFYVQKTIENGWSRSVLTHQIESGLYERKGKAITNFSQTLPETQSDLANIGILLCKNRDKLVVEYALSDIHKPMGVSEYQLTHMLPDNLKSSLPSIEEIEAELSGEGK